MRYDDKPEIMAIGDSMYQGVRSLSFTSELARWSPPAQVAATLNVPFTVPNPRVPILFDLERMFRHGGLLHLMSAIRDSTLQNMAFWLGADPWSQHEAFDNVAIGGAAIDSLYLDTYETRWPSVPRLVERIKAAQTPDPAAIAELWYALNTCFTLNPRRRPDQARKSQLDQVADRKPRILLVNIGSNEGLFHAAFAGDFGESTLASVRAIPEKMRPVADRLAALPPEVEAIVFNAMVRPRVATNLTSREDFSSFPGDGYFDSYVTRIGSGRDIPGATVKAFDELVRDVNAEVRALLAHRVGARLKWIDLYDTGARHDGKHYFDRGLEVQPDGDYHNLRNIPINAAFGSLIAGGLSGLDNMHPTLPGYALIADDVLAAIAPAAGRTDKDAAYRADSLLNGLPYTWTFSQFEFAVLGLTGLFSRGLRTV